SSQKALVGTGNPLRESLPGLALLRVTTNHPLHIRCQLGGSDLVAAQLAAEPAVQPQAPTQVHLEALDLVALDVRDQLTLEPDVRDLNPTTRLRASVELHRHRNVQSGLHIGEPPLQPGDER